MLDDEAEVGDAVDLFTRSVTDSMDTALAAILRKASLHTITDSQFGGVIVAGTRPADDLEALGL